MNFYTKTKNPIARAGIINKLIKKGYRLIENETPESYAKENPADIYPVVWVAGEDAPMTEKCDINHRGDIYVMTENYLRRRLKHFSATFVKSNCIDAVPWLDENKQKEKSEIIYPAPAKYWLVYNNGETKDYLVSNPIEEKPDRIICYAFNHGIRAFKKSKILSFSKML